MCDVLLTQNQNAAPFYLYLIEALQKKGNPKAASFSKKKNENYFLVSGAGIVPAIAIFCS